MSTLPRGFRALPLPRASTALARSVVVLEDGVRVRPRSSRSPLLATRLPLDLCLLPLRYQHLCGTRPPRTATASRPSRRTSGNALEVQESMRSVVSRCQDQLRLSPLIVRTPSTTTEMQRILTYTNGRKVMEIGAVRPMGGTAS